ncbi:MAG: HAD family phosphatase [Alphaproteobacteria bacterium]|nr:HAD family phosphatase [Alphaproteobacteria bacterium]
MAIPKLVIFDCDGVLVDTENLANRRLAEWLTAAGFTTSFEYCRRHFSGRSMVSVQKEIEEATPVRLGTDFVERWNAGLPDLFSHGVEAIPYVREFVDKVRAAGIAYCVASSARVSKMHITLGQTMLLPLFEHAMFSSTMVGRGKPFPDLFLHAAKTMGFASTDCIVIEDSVAGTEAGIAAGMRVFSYHADPFSDREGLAAAGGILFDDMRELAGLVPIR